MNLKSRFRKHRQQVVFVLFCRLMVAVLGFMTNTELIGSGKTLAGVFCLPSRLLKIEGSAHEEYPEFLYYRPY
jgi:hypothetical protein